MRSSAERFFSKMLNASHTQATRVINVDKNAAYPPAVEQLTANEQLPKTTELRQVKYLNNRVEQDHRNICAIDKTGNGIWFVQQRQANLASNGGNEHDLHAGNFLGVKKGDVRASIEFVSQVFGIAQ